MSMALPPVRSCAASLCPCSLPGGRVAAFINLLGIVVTSMWPPQEVALGFAVGILQFLFCWNGLCFHAFPAFAGTVTGVFAQMVCACDTNRNVRSVAAIVTTAVRLLVFLVFQRQSAGGSISHNGSKE